MFCWWFDWMSLIFTILCERFPLSLVCWSTAKKCRKTKLINPKKLKLTNHMRVWLSRCAQMCVWEVTAVTQLLWASDRPSARDEDDNYRNKCKEILSNLYPVGPFLLSLVPNLWDKDNAHNWNYSIQATIGDDGTPCSDTMTWFGHDVS